MTFDIFSYIKKSMSGEAPQPPEWHFDSEMRVVLGPKEYDPEREREFIELLKATRIRYIESLPTLDQYSPH